jgi:hypothetical protein
VSTTRLTGTGITEQIRNPNFEIRIGMTEKEMTETGIAVSVIPSF